MAEGLLAELEDRLSGRNVPCESDLRDFLLDICGGDLVEAFRKVGCILICSDLVEDTERVHMSDALIALIIYCRRCWARGVLLGVDE